MRPLHTNTRQVPCRPHTSLCSACHAAQLSSWEALGEEPSGSWCAAEAASELVKSCESFGHARVTKGA